MQARWRTSAAKRRGNPVVERAKEVVRSEGGQAMLEYILVVVMSAVAIILVVATLTSTVFDYYQMQAIWTSLPLL